MEYSPSSTYSKKMLRSIYYSSIPPLPIPKNYQKECSLILPSLTKLSPAHNCVTRVTQDFATVINGYKFYLE